MDVVSHFMGRTADLQDRYDTISELVDKHEQTLGLLGTSLHHYLLDLAIQPEVSKELMLTRRQEAVRSLLAQYEKEKDPVRKISLAGQLLRQPEEILADMGIQILRDIHPQLVQDLIVRLVVDVRVKERTKELALLQHRSNVASKCFRDGILWFRERRDEVEKNASGLPDSLRRVVREFNPSLCPSP